MNKIINSDNGPSSTAPQSKRAKRSVEDWVAEIEGLVAKQRLSIFEVGDLLLQAEVELSKKNLQTVVKRSGLKSKQNAQNYMRVARAELLRRPGIFEHLPVSAGALIDLAAWSASEIEHAIREKILHPQSERAKLRKWRQDRWCPPVKKTADTARVVGYIMCDANTYDFGRSYDFWESFDQIKLKFLDGDMFISPFENDVNSIYRTTMLAKRVWAAYSQNPALFVNPRFHKLIEEKGATEGSLICFLADFAPLIASGDHIALHRIIRFSKSDWKFLGVNDVGYATLLSYLVDTGCPA
jgi:hypothetical protein